MASLSNCTNPNLLYRTLDIERVCVQHAIPECVLRTAEIEQVMSCTTREMLLRLSAFVCTDKIQDETKTVTYPATWWDHFKKEAIPTFTRWFRLKVHEKYVSIRFERKEIHPHIPVELPAPKSRTVYYHEKLDIKRL